MLYLSVDVGRPLCLRFPLGHKKRCKCCRLGYKGQNCTCPFLHCFVLKTGRSYFTIMLRVFWNFSTRGNNKELPGSSWGLTSVEGTLPQRKIIKRKSCLPEKLQHIWWNSVWNLKVWMLDNLRKRAFTSSVWKEKLFKLWKSYWFYCCNIYDPLFIGHATISLVILNLLPEILSLGLQSPCAEHLHYRNRK